MALFDEKMALQLPAMEYRFLGKTGLKVSVIGLGSWLTYGGHVEDGNHHCLSHPKHVSEDYIN